MQLRSLSTSARRRSSLPALARTWFAGIGLGLVAVAIGAVASNSGCSGSNVPAGSCSSDTECVTGQTCQNQQCVAADCASMACGSNERCAAGRCLPQSCGQVSCAAGQVCSGGACTDETCVSKTCGAAEACVKGGCFPRDCAGSQCGSDKLCSDGTCVERSCAGVKCGAGEVCSRGLCSGSGCTDSARNGSETDVDCGGSCPPCSDGKICATFKDCTSQTCSAGFCSPASVAGDGGASDAASSDGGSRDAGDLDGGASDATSGDGGSGDAAGLDGGAADAASGDGGSGDGSALDAAGGDGGIVPSDGGPVCGDGVQNGNETDVDCGGACAPCSDGKRCNGFRDCTSQVCAAGTCAPLLGGDSGTPDTGFIGPRDAGAPDTGGPFGRDAGSCDGGPANVCGGCGFRFIEYGRLGDACGGCGGVWACNGPDQMVCNGPSRNACGGCAPLSGTAPGNRCGTCGTTVCSGTTSTTCADKPASDVCGGCGNCPWTAVGRLSAFNTPVKVGGSKPVTVKVDSYAIGAPGTCPSKCVNGIDCNQQNVASCFCVGIDVVVDGKVAGHIPTSGAVPCTLTGAGFTVATNVAPGDTVMMVATGVQSIPKYAAASLSWTETTCRNPCP